MDRCDHCHIDLWDGDGVALCAKHAATDALLEALERVVNEANCNPGSCGSCDRARAAIKLAKGEMV